MTASPVSVTPDAAWFAVAVTVPTASSEDFLNELAAAFAEDPDGIAARLLELHALNGQVEDDVREGDEYAAQHSSGQADEARAALAKDLPLDVTVRLSEDGARSLSEAALFAARTAFSARNRAGHDPLRKAEPLRSVA